MSLPLELVDAACEYLDSPALAAVARSSSLLCAVAQRILYRDVAIARPNLPLTVALAAKPRLARHVRAFKIVVDSTSNVLPAYYRALSTALSQMPELVSLSISIPPRLTSSDALPSGPGVCFPRLRSFQASFTLDQHLVGFLRNAPRVAVLSLDGTAHSLYSADVPATLLPHLEVFSGSSHVAEALVPGRPVSAIFLTSGDLTVDAVAAFAQSAAPVWTLDATTTSLPLPILETLAEAMPELENIRLTTTYNLWDEFFNTVSPLRGCLLHRLRR